MSQPVWFSMMLDSLSPDVLEEWYERAAIIQYDAGYAKGHAECLALILMIRKYGITFDAQNSASYRKGENTSER